MYFTVGPKCLELLLGSASRLGGFRPYFLQVGSDTRITRVCREEPAIYSGLILPVYVVYNELEAGELR